MRWNKSDPAAPAAPPPASPASPAIAAFLVLLRFLDIIAASVAAAPPVTRPVPAAVFSVSAISGYSGKDMKREGSPAMPFTTANLLSVKSLILSRHYCKFMSVVPYFDVCTQ